MSTHLTEKSPSLAQVPLDTSHIEAAIGKDEEPFVEHYVGIYVPYDFAYPDEPYGAHKTVLSEVVGYDAHRRKYTVAGILPGDAQHSRTPVIARMTRDEVRAARKDKEMMDAIERKKGIVPSSIGSRATSSAVPVAHVKTPA